MERLRNRKYSTLIGSGVKRNIRPCWEWLGIVLKLCHSGVSSAAVRLPSVCWLRDQVSSGVWIIQLSMTFYRAEPCMKCRRTPRHRAKRCSFSTGSAGCCRGQFWLNQRNCQRWVGIRGPGESWVGLGVRDLSHGGLLQSRTNLVLPPLLKLFNMQSSWKY